MFVHGCCVRKNTSYIWWSLLATRDVIHDGRSIEVSIHTWLSHKPIFLGEQQQNLMVKDLIDATTLQWDRDKVFNLFAHRTRLEILSISLQDNPNRDVLMWKENNSQTFLVKFAYQVVIRLKEQTWIEHSTASRDQTNLRQIWKLNVPPKVRNLVWRACSNILPTRESLQRRRVKVDAHCELCFQQLEFVGHLLWECPFARNV